MFGSFFVFAIVLVVAQLGYRQFVVKRRTTAAVAATAATGLAVSAEAEDAPPLPFELFNRGHGRRVRNRMWDPKDPNASVFDYQYTVSSGTGDNRSSRTYRQTCAVYAVPFASPGFVLSRQGFLDRIAVSFGGRDVQIGHPEFDERYRVKCQDEAFARAVLDPRFVDFLMREGRGGEIGVELAGNHVLVATGEELPVDQFDELLAYGHRLIGHLPSWLAERAGAPAWTPGGQVGGQVGGPVGPVGRDPLAAPGAVIPPPGAPPRPPLSAPPGAAPAPPPPPATGLDGRPRSTPIE